jgi:hypothetical protein
MIKIDTELTFKFPKQGELLPTEWLPFDNLSENEPFIFVGETDVCLKTGTREYIVLGRASDECWTDPSREVIRVDLEIKVKNGSEKA